MRTISVILRSHQLFWMDLWDELSQVRMQLSRRRRHIAGGEIGKYIVNLVKSLITGGVR